MLDDIVDTVIGDRVRVGPRLLDRGAVARPAGGDRLVTGLAEQVDPRVPRGRVQPQTVNEDNRSAHDIPFGLPAHSARGRMGQRRTLTAVRITSTTAVG